LEEPRIAGPVLPEWILALKTLIELVGGGLTIAGALRKILKGNVDKKEVINQGNMIERIGELNNFILIINEAKKPRSTRKKSKKSARKA